MSLEVRQLPALEDNYNFLLTCSDTQETVTVDPSGFSPVGDAAIEAGQRIKAIWNTHHHFDHIGGNLEIKRHFDCEIIGPRYDQDRIPGIDKTVEDGDFVHLGNLKARVIFVPGHTRGHIAYYFKSEGVLFIGDTLFSMGCGRMFEGNPPQFWATLESLMELPDETRVYCAHEYTLSNAEFALSVEPDNEDLQQRTAEVRVLRQQNRPTVPTCIGLEKRINPFLRAHQPSIKQALNMQDRADDEVFGELRRRKDHF